MDWRKRNKYWICPHCNKQSIRNNKARHLKTCKKNENSGKKYNKIKITCLIKI